MGEAVGNTVLAIWINRIGLDEVVRGIRLTISTEAHSDLAHPALIRGVLGNIIDLRAAVNIVANFCPKIDRRSRKHFCSLCIAKLHIQSLNLAGRIGG